MKPVDFFNEERERLNSLILSNADKNTKRFFNLDHNVYKDNVLSKKTKEMMGLTASLMLRCDDCVKYHIKEAVDEGVVIEEFRELFSVALVIGGSILIPHLRKAYSFLDSLINFSGTHSE